MSRISVYSTLASKSGVWINPIYPMSNLRLRCRLHGVMASTRYIYDRLIIDSYLCLVQLGFVIDHVLSHLKLRDIYIYIYTLRLLHDMHLLNWERCRRDKPIERVDRSCSSKKKKKQQRGEAQTLEVNHDQAIYKLVLLSIQGRTSARESLERR